MASPGASTGAQAGAAVVARLLGGASASMRVTAHPPLSPVMPSPPSPPADELGDVSHLTVEEWLKGHMERLAGAADAMSDEAVDTLLLAHKQAREEIRNWQHQGRAEAAVKSKAAKRVTWNVVLCVESTGGSDAGAGGPSEEAVGRTFTLTPRQRAGGMCRIGRSTGADFIEPRGCSLPFDASISVWHGKFTAVCGSIFYSDLATRNGSTHNGCVVCVW